MGSESYWLDSAPAFTSAQRGAVEGQVDVVVVGGGLTGLSAARALAMKGASVVVLEAAQVIGEASGRNGGQCNTGIAQDFGAMAASRGVDQARAFYQAYADAVTSVQQIIEQEQIACDFSRNGKLKLAAKPQHVAGMEKTCELIRREVDADVAMLSREEVRSEVQSDQFHAGLLQRHGIQMHVGKFGVGLPEASVRHCAVIYENAAVTGWQKQADGYRVDTARGQIRARQLLMATGASQVGPLNWYRRRMAPVGSFIIVTEPMAAERLQALLPMQRSYVTSRIIGNYFRITGDNRLLFGGRARFAMSNPRSDALSGEVLKKAMTEMFPQLAGVRPAYCWGGLVDMTADRLPRAGEHEGIYYSMGYSGHGVQMSTHMGPVMAEVMGGNVAANPWRELSWPAIPGHFGKPWFLPLVGAYYRLQDHLH